MMYTGGGIPNEIRYSIVQDTRGRGLDIGTGPFKAFPHFIGVRERNGDHKMPAHVAADYWVDTFNNLGDFADGSLDFIFVHHVTISEALRNEALRLLKDGASLIEAVIGADGAAQAVGFFVKRGDAFVSEDAPERPEKTACVVRYGAIGDTLQATSVLRALKQEGYHVTWMCEPLGHELLRHETRIDKFLIQDKDQVPNHELTAYWAEMAKRFDKFVNLCESVEGSLITLPGRCNYNFPDKLRHEICNHNYLEFTAKVADLPFYPEHFFVPSEDEERRAKEFVAGLNVPTEKAVDGQPLIGVRRQRPFVIMWALSGSSPHKTYPHMDAVIARILVEIPHAHIVTVGDAACAVLEAGWENEPRVHCRSGEMELRDTLALAIQCDLVVGPETGVLNAVAFESNAKVVMLSHSSHENLTKHWRNTEALWSREVPCYPCHRLHYDRSRCPQEPITMTAMCAATIGPGEVWEAVKAAYLGRETVNRILTP